MIPNLNKEEKVEICSKILLSSPPGELNDVFNSIRGIINDDDLLKNECSPAVAKYNLDNFHQVRQDLPNPCLITKYNQLGNDRFLEPQANVTFKFDHIRREVSDITPAEKLFYSEDLNKWRKVIQIELNKYVERSYKNSGVGVVFVYDGQLVVCIESHQFRPKSFWNGRMKSCWFIPPFDGKNSTMEISGTVKLDTHYFEDGNVQLKMDHTYKPKCVASNIGNMAIEVVKAIGKSEDSYQATINETYMAQIEEVFKQLRRSLPITKTKFDWNKIHNYKIAQDMSPNV
uniref:F-actin-capping protein subunit alpha n=1 Tax=Strongyloides stercoralis TaxID=6248 RepID=A0A0K0EB89_STRER